MESISDWLSSIADAVLPPFVGAGVAGAIQGGTASAGNGNTDTPTGITAGAVSGAGQAVGGFWDSLATLPASLQSLLPDGTSLLVGSIVVIVVLLLIAYILKEVEV